RAPALRPLAVGALALLLAGAAAPGSGIRVPRGFRVSAIASGLTHPTALVRGPGGRLYATEDVGRLVEISAGRPRVVARGLRTPFGLAFEPGTTRLYASVNGQDGLGRNEPAETVVRVRRGANYGWPRCWPSYRRRRLVGSCRGVTRPHAYLEPHSSADG